MRGIASLIVVLVAGGCGPGETAEQPDAGPVLGPYHHYVSSSLLLPQSPAEATDYGVDLDGDAQHVPDNALGRILAALASNGLDSSSALSTAVASGDILLLHSVRSENLVNDGSVSWQVFLAAEDPAPDFSGAGAFVVAADSPTDALLLGRISGAEFAGGPRTILLRVAIAAGQPPIEVHLVGARIEADLTATTCVGRIGGAISGQELDGVVLPAVAQVTNQQIAEDCPGGACTAGSSGETFLDLFDTDGSGDVSVPELKASDLIGTFLAPDVDLLDGAGNYAPRSDGVKDCLSLGIGMTCVQAAFAAPGER